MTATLSSTGYMFSIPTGEAVDTSCLIPDTASFTRWLQELPSANVEHVATEILQQLRAVNHSEINPQQRLQLLRLVQPLAEQSIDALLEHVSGRSFPLGKKYLLTAKKLESLTCELAGAYLLVVNALMSDLDNADLPLIDTAIFMSMRYMHKQLYQCYLLYRETPSKIWQNIHQLYKCAADHSLLRKRIMDEDEENDVYSTRYRTEALYKKSLLLHLAGPHRLRQSDLARLETILEQCAGYSVLYNSADSSNEKAGFCIALNKDIALVPLATDVKTSSNIIYHFSAIPLAKLISHRIHSPQDENIFQPLPIETCKRLMLSWGVLSKRLFSRKTNQTDEKRLVATGMVNTHYYLSNEESFIEYRENKTTRPPSSPSGSNINNILKDKNLWDKIHTSPGASEFFAPDEQVVMQSSSARSFPSHLWKVVNESAGGYCLRSNADISGCIAVGELVSVKTINNIGHKDWKIGVVRWIKYLLEEKMEIGIQMIAPSANALAISGSRHEKQLNSRAFLLPDVQAIKQPATIITPGIPYASGDIIDLYQGNETRRLKLLRMMDDTGSYRQFEYKTLGNLAATNS